MAAASAKDDAKAQGISYRRAEENTYSHYTLCIIAPYSLALNKRPIMGFRHYLTLYDTSAILL